MSRIARLNEPAGAVSFADYWFAALDWAYASDDSTLLRQQFSTACADCVRTTRNFDDGVRRGQTFRGGRISIDDTSITENDRRHGADYAVDVTVDIGAWKTIDASGRVVNHGAARQAMVYRLWIRWSGDRWLVVDFKQVRR